MNNFPLTDIELLTHAILATSVVGSGIDKAKHARVAENELLRRQEEKNKMLRRGGNEPLDPPSYI